MRERERESEREKQKGGKKTTRAINNVNENENEKIFEIFISHNKFCVPIYTRKLNKPTVYAYQTCAPHIHPLLMIQIDYHYVMKINLKL